MRSASPEELFKLAAGDRPTTALEWLIAENRAHLLYRAEVAAAYRRRFPTIRPSRYQLVLGVVRGAPRRIGLALINYSLAFASGLFGLRRPINS